MTMLSNCLMLAGFGTLLYGAVGGEPVIMGVGILQCFTALVVDHAGGEDVA